MLFFPSDLGGGFGHVGRCLALARAAKHRGHTCAFAINKNKYAHILSKNFKIFAAKNRPWYKCFLNEVKNRFSRTTRDYPLYTEFCSLDYQVLRDGLVTEKIVKSRLSEYHNIVRNFKPDVLVGDTNLLVWILSKITNLPAVQIVRYASHPNTAKLLWWKNESGDRVPPDSAALFNPLLDRMRLERIRKAEDLLRGDFYLVPSIPEIEPIPENGESVHVGALSNAEVIIQEAPEWFNEIDHNQPLIYITIGGGAGTVGNKAFFDTIIEAFVDKPIQVVVSTSNKFSAPTLTNSLPNMRFFQWVPGRFLISKADLVVFHGGYGTMMECLSSGKPTITIPYHSEQEGNGRRLEQLGCGTVLKLSQESFKRMENKWRFGTYSFLVQDRYDLTAQELYEEVSKILSHRTYLKNARNLQASLEKYGGPEAAIHSIEKSFL